MSAYLASKEDRIRSQLSKRIGQQHQLQVEKEEKKEKEEEDEINGSGPKPAKLLKLEK